MKNWTVNDVMTEAVVSVDSAATYRDVVDVLTRHRFSAVPVVDAFQHVVGVVSEADLLRKIEYEGDGTPRLFESRRRRGERAKAGLRTVADLMSRPPVTVLSGTAIAAAARQMDTEDVKRLPVNDDLGRLIGIVSRGDLLKVHLRPDDEILADVENEVINQFLVEDSAKVIAAVVHGVVTLSGKVDRGSSVDIATRLTRRIPGVVDVISTIEFAYDDREALTAGMFFGVA
uniref:CBS domain-containing protein n=1 Tax=Paractinoplanes polyasparticus TaxID=2856853 RepID=UPI001C85A817|nr:CBS domain-containing protein [Actinoplanes polyasparticus]